ncbi:MAG: penicillin-binding protein activator [Gammaproteobacteria bacterium]|nr:penicillin-binding protein activator [Gammaproteobacteria bacterium]
MQKTLALLLSLLLLLLAGCADRPLRPTEPAATPGVATLAEEAMRNEEYPRAIQLYQTLANESAPPLRYEYRYLAALAMFRDGLAQQANQTLDDLPLGELPPELLFKRQLLLAEIPLKRDPDLTLSLLLQPAVSESLLPDENELFARYHQLRARAFARLGNHLETAREYILRGFYLTEQVHAEANQLAIWQALSMLTSEALEQLRIQPPPDALSGWMELVAIAKDYSLSPAEVSQRIDAWRNRYRGHPASEQVFDLLLERSHELASRPANIALLLPLSGRYAKAGAAIQDGILAAYFNDPQRHTITLRSYDIGEQSSAEVSRLYQRAVDDGAQFIIGPLDKAAVATLAVRESLPVPTLALNHAQPAANDQLYQFSLAPEDEAREVAERAWLEGYTQAAVLVPDNPLGERLNLAFSEHWQALGGLVISAGRYLEEKNDFATPIKSLLNINDSERRHLRVRQLVGGKVEFIPRRRQDLDFVFIAANPRQARLLRPQMKFHYAGELPLLATSHLYEGKTNRDQDRDMDGILFCDMPWTLNAPSAQQALKQQNATAFKPHGGQLQRLLAMGIDAYQLVPLLPLLESHPYERYRGETGSLRVTEGRRIGRRLQWARFEGGLPQLEQEATAESETVWQNQP